ncbi:MAG: hypothetical protein ACRBCT_08585 [Alphaproteobacteria bacterium]
MTDEQDYTFLTKPISDFAEPEVISQYCNGSPTRIRNQLSELRTFFGEDKPLDRMGQLLVFDKAGSWDGVLLSGRKTSSGTKEKLLPRKTSIYLTDVFHAHGWKPGALAHERDNLITNYNDAFTRLVEISQRSEQSPEALVELDWQRKLEISRAEITALGLTPEELHVRLSAITDEQLIEMAMANPPEPL